MSIDSPFHVHFSFPGFEQELEDELKQIGVPILDKKERLFLTQPLGVKPLWSQCSWLDPQWIEISSINEAVKKLKTLHSNWMGYSYQLHRRTDLIQQKLLRVNPKPLHFLKKPPMKNFGAWTLWSENILLASAQTTSALPLGEAVFNENKEIPSRAYLKLWELFTLYEEPPQKGLRVLDLGSCPGGWTWVLSDLNCEVVSVDKAPIDERLLKRKNVHTLKKDAFKLVPEDVGAVDTVFSDIICEPARLYDLVQTWRLSGLCRRIICSIKFKGKTDYAMIEKFKAIPKSRIYHLCANKHELTFVCEID